MEKWAVITGASSGIGMELAKLYASRGYSIVLVARRADRLLELAMSLETDTRVIALDLSERINCESLHEQTKDLDVRLLINCAGFGAAGRFDEIDLDKQIEMTQLNCISLMTLTHMYLNDFKKMDCGTILNVASSAGLLPGGPNMAVYYATKSYVVSLTNAISEELKDMHSNVKIAALCPGPVKTEFNDVAGVRFALNGITPQYCAKCAALGLDKGERIIIPEAKMKLVYALNKILPQSLMLKGTGFQQKKKTQGRKFSR